MSDPFDGLEPAEADPFDGLEPVSVSKGQTPKPDKAPTPEPTPMGFTPDGSGYNPAMASAETNRQVREGGADLAVGAGSSLTFDWDDEIAKFLGNDKYGERKASAERRNPEMNALGRVIGAGVASAVLPAGATSTLARTVGTAGLEGVVQGAGAAPTVGDIPEQALKQGAANAVTAGALGAPAALVRNAPRLAKSAALRGVSRRLRSLGMKPEDVYNPAETVGRLQERGVAKGLETPRQLQEQVSTAITAEDEARKAWIAQHRGVPVSGEAIGKNMEERALDIGGARPVMKQKQALLDEADSLGTQSERELAERQRGIDEQIAQHEQYAKEQGIDLAPPSERKTTVYERGNATVPGGGGGREERVSAVAATERPLPNVKNRPVKSYAAKRIENLRAARERLAADPALAEQAQAARAKAGAIQEPPEGAVVRRGLRKRAQGFRVRENIPMEDADVARQAALQEANAAYNAASPKQSVGKEAHQALLEEMSNAAGPESGPKLRDIGRAQADLFEANKGVGKEMAKSEKAPGLQPILRFGEYGAAAAAGMKMGGPVGAAAGMAGVHFLRGRGQSAAAYGFEKAAQGLGSLDSPFTRAASSGLIEARTPARQAIEHYTRSMTDPVYREVYAEDQ